MYSFNVVSTTERLAGEGQCWHMAITSPIYFCSLTDFSPTKIFPQAKICKAICVLFWCIARFILCPEIDTNYHVAISGVWNSTLFQFQFQCSNLQMLPKIILIFIYTNCIHKNTSDFFMPIFNQWVSLCEGCFLELQNFLLYQNSMLILKLS
jgi:hypothetical protein